VASAIELGRIGLFGLMALAISWTGCGVTLAPPGFVREQRQATCRGWLDWNSHRRFSFTFETYDRLPPDSARVKLFRWSHGGSVDEPRQVSFEREVRVSEDFAASGNPAGSQPQPPPAAGPGGTTTAPGSVEILPPPPAPPQETEDPGEPLPNDSLEEVPFPGPEESHTPPQAPLVSISFSESLEEPDHEAGENAKGCSVPSAVSPFLE
jgi:hypothetical protein